MRDAIREQLDQQMTRKQFLQYLAGILLAVFGFHNLIGLITSNRYHPRSPMRVVNDNATSGFGSSRFGV